MHSTTLIPQGISLLFISTVARVGRDTEVLDTNPAMAIDKQAVVLWGL